MSRITGFGSFKKQDEGSDSDEGKQNELYTGGIGARGGSGMAVLGPPSGKRNPPGTDVFNKLVQAAQGHGAAAGGDMETPPADEEMNTITMYSNGFTVNNGPLRDPKTSSEDQAFLDQLLKGYVPAELKKGRKDPSKPMNISLSDKRGETYTPPPYTAFSHGTTLGSSSSATSRGQYLPGSLPPAPVVDESKPTTTIQVRTSTGKKLKLKVNLTTTVYQLAALVVAEAGGTAAFSLSAGFPPKDLMDGSATIEAAGLQGAAVTQK